MSTKKAVSELDRSLRQCHSLEEWQQFEPQDVIVFTMFGTVAPDILRKSHRLVKCSTQCFEDLLGALGARGALITRVPPTIAATPPEYGINRSIPKELAAWVEEPNQRWLTSQIENLKFTSVASVICDAQLPVETATTVYNMLIDPVDSPEWFKRAGDLLDSCRWLYITLPEAVEVDLLLLANSQSRHVLSALDAMECVSSAEWQGDVLKFPITPPLIKTRELGGE